MHLNLNPAQVRLIFASILTISYLLLGSGCQQDGQFLQSSESLLNKKDERPTDSNEGVPGYSLTCDVLNENDEKADEGDRLGCLLVDKDKKPKNPQNIERSYRWHVASNIENLNVDTQQFTEGPFHVVFKFLEYETIDNKAAFISSLKPILTIDGDPHNRWQVTPSGAVNDDDPAWHEER